MRHLSPLVLLLAIASCGSQAPFQPGNGNNNGAPTANGTTCTATGAGAAGCEGMLCLSLKANKQGKSGICTEACTGTCKFGGSCVNIPSGAAMGNYCFLECQTDANCVDGFVCNSGICLVTTTAAAPADCAGAKCPTQTDNASIQGYCANVAGTTQVCDCPGAPPAGCTASGNGANLWCCP